MTAEGIIQAFVTTLGVVDILILFLAGKHLVQAFGTGVRDNAQGAGDAWGKIKGGIGNFGQRIKERNQKANQAFTKEKQYERIRHNLNDVIEREESDLVSNLKHIKSTLEQIKRLDNELGAE